VSDPRRGDDAFSADRAGVLVIGSVNWDLVLVSDRLPQVGETIAGAEIAGGLGGKGANQAVAAARMGAAVSLVGFVGDDPEGSTALEILAAEGVGVADCRLAARPTGRAAVLVDHAGENLIVVGPGANALLGPDDVHAAAWPLNSRVMLTQLEISPMAAATGIGLAREHGMTSVLNATPAAVLDEVGEVPDILIVNRVEAGQLLGGAGDGAAGELAVALAAARGIATVVVTDGPRGAAAAVDGGAGQTIAAASPRVDVLDTTGAGDAFAGALAASLAEDVALARALTRGCAAGALACTTVGAVRSLPHRDAVLAAAVR
jgi:ribokinase